MLRLYFHQACRLLDEQCAGGLADIALDQAGLRRTDLYRPDRMLDFDHYFSLLHWLYESRVIPVPGLQLGLLRRLEDFGPYGQNPGETTTFGELLRLAERFFLTCWAHGRFHITRVGSKVICHYDVAPTTVCAPEVRLQVLTATALGMGPRLLPGVQFSRAEVCYGFAAPPDASEYRHRLGCRVTFGAPRTQVQLPVEWLQEVLVADAAEGPALIDALALCQARERLGSMTEQVCRLIEERCADRFPLLSEVAHTLGCSERTVERRLAGEGTSYRKELDGLRMRLAERYLMRTNLSIADISAVLGYGHPPSFYRAFRQHFGVPPHTLRDASMRRDPPVTTH